MQWDTHTIGALVGAGQALVTGVGGWLMRELRAVKQNLRALWRRHDETQKAMAALSERIARLETRLEERNRPD